jgi:hypothetical protein
MKTFFCNRTVDKSEMKRLIKWIVLNYGTQKATRFVDHLKTLGFHYATSAGISLGIDDLRIPPIKAAFLKNAEKDSVENDLRYKRGQITAVEKLEKALDIWNTTNDTLKNEVIDHFRETDIFNPVYMMAFSGARGNISQVRQLVGMRGLMADQLGQIVDFPIRSNFREGLTVTEYMISCYGARKGLVDTALRTANSGYLTRRLVDVAQNVIIQQLDCETKEGLEIIPSPNHDYANLIGRVLFQPVVHARTGKCVARKNMDISPVLATRLATLPKIVVRSPLTCRFNIVCQLCYGWDLSKQKLVQLGEAVGVLAAQSIGEPGTQLTMRTFHTGGVFAGEATEKVYAPHAGLISYSARPRGYKVISRYGEPAFLTVAPVAIKIRRKDRAKSIILQFPSSTLLFIFPGQYVAFHQSLAELSRLEPETGVPSTTKDVTIGEKQLFAPADGQVYLEQVNLQNRTPKGQPSKPPRSTFPLYGPDGTPFTMASYFPQDWAKKKDVEMKEYRHSLRDPWKDVHGYGFIWIIGGYLLEHNRSTKGDRFNQNFQPFTLTSHYWQDRCVENVPVIMGCETNSIPCSGGYDNWVKGVGDEPQYPEDLIRRLLAVAQRRLLCKLKPKTEQGKNLPRHLTGVPPFLQMAASAEDYYSRVVHQLVTYHTQVRARQPGLCTTRGGSPRHARNAVTVFAGTYRASSRSFNRFAGSRRTGRAAYGRVEPWGSTHLYPPSCVKRKAVCRKLGIESNIHMYETPAFPWDFSTHSKGIPWTLQRGVLSKPLGKNLGARLSTTTTRLTRIKGWNPTRYERSFAAYNALGKMLFRAPVKQRHLAPCPFKKWRTVPPNAMAHAQRNCIVALRTGYKHWSTSHQQFPETQMHNAYDMQKHFWQTLRARLLFASPEAYASMQVVGGLLPTYKEVYTVGTLVFDPSQYAMPFVWDTHPFLFPVGEDTGTNVYPLEGEIRLPKQVALTKHNQYAFNCEERKVIASLGQFIRIGDTLFEGVPSLHSGQLVHIDSTRVILRRVYPYAVSHGSSLLVEHGQFIEKDTLFGTLVSLESNAGDIVQGLPKVDELLEAREPPHKILTSVHAQLAHLFLFYKKTYGVREGCRRSLKKIRRVLVDEVQAVYGSQGVFISDKHIEIVVRQMTTKVLIIDPGPTGLLPGDVVDLRRVEHLQSNGVFANVNYRPILLGITRAALTADSFIAAASFQETKRVLARAAVEGRIDWLTGLKENVILGRLIPAGTGLYI